VTSLAIQTSRDETGNEINLFVMKDWIGSVPLMKVSEVHYY